MSTEEEQHILWFDEINIGDVGIVGGKNASLGEMYQSLTAKGVRIPNGFAITAGAYFYFLDAVGIRESIKEMMEGLDVTDTDNLEERGHKIRTLILSKDLPDNLQEKIVDAYNKLSKECGVANTDVAVRSSATAEDLPNASFAGQQETFLNIRGPVALLEACKACIASLFTNRAISYRENQGFDHFSVGLSVCVQKMVRSDLASSGVMFSIDTESGFDKVVFVTGAWGLGENIVQGNVNPDEFYVFKPTLESTEFTPIIKKTLGAKQFRMIYCKDSSRKTVKNVRTQNQDRLRFCVQDDEVITLAKWAVLIEQHYTAKNGRYTPMDMEWAKDGRDGKLYIVQARPETVHGQADKNQLTSYQLKDKSIRNESVLARGQSVGSRIGTGLAHVIRDITYIHDFKEGDVLVTEMTDPDWAPIMKKAAAIVTNRGGRTCHAAIISRELGVPCVVGCQYATESIPDGSMITVDCSNGETGYVYEGVHEYIVEHTDVAQIPKTKTKVMLILGNPALAYDRSFMPAQGIGLVRMEFMVMTHIKAHPLALLNMDKLDKDESHEISLLIQGYESPSDYFVSKLSEGIAEMTSAFYPHDVILRFSDFKSNEYSNLIGGSHFEPKEENPMLGWRGASRYYDPKYKPGFALECAAVKRVREEIGLKNLIVMIPFCRTVEEAHKVLNTMAEFGLKQGEHGLKVYGMCEIPSNVILADEFLDVLDGFSIGSNDLTQLTLGVDRDSELVAGIYDERNPAVIELFRRVIEVANRKGKYIGICGQAPSDYPELCDLLIELGIGSISVNSDRLLATLLQVAKKEKEMAIEAAAAEKTE
eukprot:m.19082 g.19082  ORF g.19082 m.19082 type:complete len:819 (-) comp5064_c0_seq1:411-2867(-)